MRQITKLKLAAAHQLCDEADKSTEFTMQFLQDSCKVNLDTVNAYLLNEDHEKLFKEVTSFIEFLESIMDCVTPKTL